MRSIERWHFQWPWRTPNPVFKITVFLKSNVSKTVRLTDKFTIEHTIPNVSNGTMFADFDWPLSSSLGFVNIIWACWLLSLSAVLCSISNTCIWNKYLKYLDLLCILYLKYKCSISYLYLKCILIVIYILNTIVKIQNSSWIRRL